MVDPASDEPEPAVYPLDGYTRDQPTVALNVPVPHPVKARLEALTALLPGPMRELGDVTETELVAVLIDTADANQEQLANRVAAYRHAKVHETLMTTKTDGTVHLAHPRRGRRKKPTT